MSTQPATAPAPRRFFLVFGLLLAAHVVLVACIRIYPFVDLPSHLATATVIRHYGDPSLDFYDYFTVLGLPRPNMLHALVCSRAWLPPVEVVHRILFALYVVALPISVYAIIRKLRGNPWFSLLAFPLLYNYNVSWGFVGFMLAIPLVLVAVRLSIDDLEARWKTALIAVLFLLLYVTHVLASLFAAAVFVTARLAYRRAIRPAVLDSVGLLPWLIVVSGWWKWVETHHPFPGLREFLIEYYRGEYLATLHDRLAFLVQDNRYVSGDHGTELGLLFSAIILVPGLTVLGIRLVRRRSAGAGAAGRDPGARAVAAAPALLVGSVLAYLLLPDRIPGNWFLYQRFSVCALLGTLFLASLVPLTRRRRGWTVAIAALALLHLGLWGRYFIGFDRDNAGLTPDLFPAPRSSQTLAGLVYEELNGLPVYGHTHAYYTVWRLGIATLRSVDYRFSLIRRKVTPAELPPHRAMGTVNNYDGWYSAVDDILVRSPEPERLPHRFADFRLLRKNGHWALYEKAVDTTSAGESRPDG